jgi:hypothetical protein
MTIAGFGDDLIIHAGTIARQLHWWREPFSQAVKMVVREYTID